MSLLSLAYVVLVIIWMDTAYLLRLFYVYGPFWLYPYFVVHSVFRLASGYQSLS